MVVLSIQGDQGSPGVKGYKGTDGMQGDPGLEGPTVRMSALYIPCKVYSWIVDKTFCSK